MEIEHLHLLVVKSEDEEAKKFSKRTAYIETGVNLADLSASLDGIKPIKNDKFTVFTLGRACVQKQPALFNRIAELVPEAQFVWIGNGELENELTASNIEVTDGNLVRRHWRWQKVQMHLFYVVLEKPLQ